MSTPRAEKLAQELLAIADDSERNSAISQLKAMEPALYKEVAVCLERLKSAARG